MTVDFNSTLILGETNMLSVKEEDIDRITEVFYNLTKGKTPADIKLPEDYPDNEIKQLVEYVNRFLEDYRTNSEFALNLGKGVVDAELPRNKTSVLQALKSLQSSLHHLTWTTQQIAKGDFSHKVSFMGEFSNAFNSMTEQLKHSFKEREQSAQAMEKQIEELAKARRAMLNIMEDLKLSQAGMSALIGALPDVTMIYNREGTYQKVYFRNIETEERGTLEGYEDFEQLIAKNVDEVLPGEIAKKIKSAIKDALELNKTVQIEYNLPTILGNRWYDARFSPMNIEDSEQSLVVSVARDITNIKQLTSDLESNRQRLDLALEASNTGLWEWSPISGQTFQNEQWFRQLGYQAEEFSDNPNPFNAIMHPEDADRVYNKLNKCRTERSDSYESEFRLKAKDGSWKWILSKGKVVLRNSQGEAERFVGVHLDITERKSMEQELYRAKEEAEAATKAKSDFLANMSHEIRTPMNAIMGMTHLALQTDLTPKQQDYMKKTYGAATSLLGLINDILDFSKIEAGKMDMEAVGFHLDDVLDNVSTLISTKAGDKGLALEFQTPSTVPRFLIGDSLRLGQVLINLSNNAVKFTDKGAVTIETSLVEETPEQLILQFTVRDTGIGLTREQIGKLFKSFSQADTSITRKFGGTGLGLTISKRLVEMMNGEIWVESDPGKGSSFIFTAVFGHGNASEITVRSSQQQLDESALRSIQGAQILLVEDNEINQQVAQELLENSGFFVDIAENGLKAVEAVEAKDYDIVLMDIQMPVMDGYQATTKIRQNPEFTSLPILAMSASAMTQDQEDAVSAGMNDHVPKPVQPHQLFSSLLKWIKPGNRPLPEAKLEPASQDALPASELPDQLPGIDFVLGLSRVVGNQSLYLKLLKKFKKNQESVIAEIKTELQNGELKTAERLAHTVKGVSGNIGAMDLHAAAIVLEAGIKEHGASLADNLISATQNQLDIVLNSIEKLTEENDNSLPKGEEAASELDMAKIGPILKDLENRIENDDTDAADVLEKLRPLIKDHEMMKKLDAVEEALSDYDFEDAMEHFQSLHQFLTPEE
jgi:PAS domain S-box-containing protein